MKKSYFLLFIFVFLIISIKVYSYDSDSTHPAITSNAITRYKITFSNNVYPSLITQGSIEEDYPGIEQVAWSWSRYYNHFLGPNKEGWKGWPNAKNWAKSSIIQSAWVKYTLEESPERFYIPEEYKIWIKDFSYETAIQQYEDHKSSDKNFSESYLSLGHVAHLVEDMGSPAHVWNDTHVLDIWATVGEIGQGKFKWVGDFYEYLVNATFKNQIPSSDEFPLSNCDGIDCLFDRFSDYTRKNFFSQGGSINDSIDNLDEAWKNAHHCSEIKIIYDKILMCYPLDEENQIDYTNPYKAAAKNIYAEFLPGDLWSWKLEDYILRSYWDLLSRKNIQYVASLINQFHKDVGDIPSPSTFTQADLTGTWDVFQ